MSQADIPFFIVWSTLFYAFLLTLVSYLIVVFNQTKFSSKAANLANRMGKGQWDFTNSWATTLTTVGALLGTILSAGGLSLTHETFNIGLNLFFGIVGLLAPFVYKATSKHQQTDADSSDGPSEFQGYVGTFLLACLLTLWAVSGELATVLNTLADLTTQNYFTPQIQLIFQIVLIAALATVFFYAAGTIPWTIHDQVTENKMKQNAIYETREASGFNQHVREQGREPKKQEEIHPSLSTWSLL